MKTQITTLKNSSRTLLLILAAIFSFGATFAGNNDFNYTPNNDGVTVASIGDNISSTARMMENAKTVHFLNQDASNAKTFHLLQGPEGETNPIVRVYNESGVLVMYQSWTGIYEIDKMEITMPDKTTSGNYNAVITSGKETWKQIITL